MLVALLAACLALPAGSQGDTGLDLRETLAGVLAYTRWPVTPQRLRLCVAGHSPHAERLLQQGLSWPGLPPLDLRRVEPGQAIAEQCDALYVGLLDAPQWLQLTSGLTGQPVLTLCERSTPCTAGGMVRLDIDADSQRVRFEINMDAVARGTVRIHPQVLRLGRRGQAQEGKP
ncbi:MAG TPA: YfiR family protein [Pseudorhodoferax sp.]|nr:YfiR family protein [Pseudorhodoferax sp.]